jgi:ParB-like chromosome segregation protein Spo0J
MTIPLDHLNVWYSYEKLTLREMVMHMNAVNKADLSKPIILDEDGELMDGRHRIMKAMLTGVATIKAVRFDENPSPCRVTD